MAEEKTCKKCGYTRQPEDEAPDYECPQCGVIYAKADQLLEQRDRLQEQVARKEARDAEQEAKRQQREAARIERQRAREQREAERKPAASANKPAPATPTNPNLQTCRTCGQPVAKKVKRCPHCGEKKPGKRDDAVSAGRVAFLLLALPILGIIIFASSQPTPKAQPCGDGDVTCHGERQRAEAIGPCSNAIEAMAKHQAEWTDSFTKRAFPYIAPSDMGSNAVVYSGDKVKFQNGFGAWTPMRYRCHYNLDTNQVITVRVFER